MTTPGSALVLEELNEPSPEPISDRLKAMPKGITGMYELILRRLGFKGGIWEHKMRQKLLLWVTLAQRPIKVPGYDRRKKIVQSRCGCATDGKADGSIMRSSAGGLE
jgi:hypothetical protein